MCLIVYKGTIIIFDELDNVLSNEIIAYETKLEKRICINLLA